MSRRNQGASADADQALAVPVEPASGLAPTGFDPSREMADWPILSDLVRGCGNLERTYTRRLRDFREWQSRVPKGARRIDQAFGDGWVLGYRAAFDRAAQEKAR